MRCGVCAHDNREGARFCDECGARLSAEAVPAAPAVPVTIGGGRYRVERFLGEGARKRVYQALDTRLDREVAVAVVKTDGLDDAGRHRIEREARAMARLGDHPNIVTVFDVGDDDGQQHIVSQYMAGGALADRLAAAEDHRFDVEEALRVAEQVALALEHAHGLGIVHRDLKPANVWLGGDGSARLGDFGLAVPIDQSRITSEGMVVGTVAYLAPEQALGHTPDGRADLYSLGALLYEMLCGRPPFLGDDTVGVISQHLNTTPVAPSWHNADVPPGVESLVMRLLAKDPAARPRDAADVAAEIRRLLDATPEPVAIPATEAPRRAAVAGEWGRFVGRDDELAELRAAFDETLAGRTRLVMIVGEPGIGKTRLAEELTTYAALRGAQVCWGRCFEGELGAPYLPFVEAFRAYVRERPDDELRAQLSTAAPEIAMLVSDVRERFPDLPHSPPLEGDAERLRLFEGVTTFLHNAATAQPIMLVLDDLHWADKPSLLLLQYLARNLVRDRVLLVGSYRDVELDRAHPLADAVVTLRRERLYERILLRGLPRDDVKVLIEVIGDQETPDEFADLVHRETEGNPFFVAEILRHLAETGALQRVDGRWVGTPESVAANLPEGVREVIGRRLDHLSEGCNRMLTVASAMPGGFGVDVVGSVTGIDVDTTLDLLDEALAARVVRERKDARGVYEFTHALIRQTLYGELSTPRRVRLHRQIGQVLEDRYGDHPDAHLPELAHHWFQAAPGGDVDKAVEYATRAGDQSRMRAAHEEAARSYDMALQALDLADGRDQVRRAELLLTLGDARNRAGEGAAAASALLDAAGLARRLSDPVLLGRIAHTYVELLYTPSGADQTAVSLLEEAVESLGPDDDALRAKLLARLAAQFAFSDPDRTLALTERAVAAGRRSGDPGALAAALNQWVYRADRDDPRDPRRAELHEEIDRLTVEAGEVDLAVYNASRGVVIGLELGDRELYETQIGRLASLAEESRSLSHRALVLQARAGLAVLQGQYADAERVAGDLLGMVRSLGDRTMVQSFGVILFPAYREQQRLVEFEESTRRAVAEFPATVAWRVGLAQLVCDLGKLDEAREHVNVLARDGFAALALDPSGHYALVGASEVVAELADATHAEQLLDLLRPAAGLGSHLGPWAYHGAVDRYLGLLAATVDRLDEAVEHYEAALAIHRRMGARPWLARSRYDLARALLVRDDPGDRERAFSELNDALDAANTIGMPRLVEQALALKLEVQGVAASSPQASIDVVAAAVSVERPDLGPHAATDGRLTILFSDIEGYTSMTERLGDRRAQAVVRAHNEIVRNAVAEHGGTEVKNQGDGFMLAFAEPGEALECARAIRRAIAGHDFGADVGTVQVRMGVHTGEVIREAQDFYGRTVIMAARIAALAQGGEVLVSQAAGDAAPGSALGAPRTVELKGLAGEHAVRPLVG
jgi:class 3 adenylate cyclase/tetratricopeptide (TPR) repeat protein